jgi:hypothetical protein
VRDGEGGHFTIRFPGTRHLLRFPVNPARESWCPPFPVHLPAGDESFTYLSGTGSDTLIGGSGDDTLYLSGSWTESSSGDWIIYSGNDVTLYVREWESVTISGDTLAAGDESYVFLFGGGNADSLMGGAGEYQYLRGQAGNDTLDGGDGNDYEDDEACDGDDDGCCFGAWGLGT